MHLNSHWPGVQKLDFIPFCLLDFFFHAVCHYQNLDCVLNGNLDNMLQNSVQHMKIQQLTSILWV